MWTHALPSRGRRRALKAFVAYDGPDHPYSHTNVQVRHHSNSPSTLIVAGCLSSALGSAASWVSSGLSPSNR
jgi:hypothetical protein